MNQMRNIRIEKVTINIGVGEAGAKLEKAMKLLKTITGQTPIQTKSKKRIPTWSLRPGLPIACKVTLRKKLAEETLARLLKAVENNLKPNCFGESGNFSFGIREYIDIPEVEYDVDVGIIGLEVAVTLERPGYRIKRRKTNKKNIPSRHLISKEEAKEFVKSKFNVNFVEEE